MGFSPRLCTYQTYSVPTVFHTIRAGANGALTQQEIEESISVLNEGYSGTLIFNFIAQTDTDNSSWYDDSVSEMDMKSALRQGGCNMLNIYSISGYGYLGFAYFPNSCETNLVSSSKPGGGFP